MSRLARLARLAGRRTPLAKGALWRSHFPYKILKPPASEARNAHTWDARALLAPDGSARIWSTFIAHIASLNHDYIIVQPIQTAAIEFQDPLYGTSADLQINIQNI